jgi:hypothetical protein
VLATDCSNRLPNGEIPLQDFIALREKCPALRDLLLPECILAQFLERHSLPDDVACHRSVVLLAFRRGVLPQITQPIHRFLIGANGLLRPEVRTQYAKDFREKWMFQSEPIERNRHYRTFRARIAELQFASFLETKGHTIVGLEAVREGPDIETIAPDASRFYVEDPDCKGLIEN